MKERFVVAGGFETHALIWNESCISDRLILIVPGNPGVAVFYVPFAASLAASHPESGIVVVGHAGHDQKRSEKGGVFVDLFGQVEHKAQVLMHAFPSKHLVLIGHSVGSWIILELLARGKVKPDFVFHLCPTFSFIYEGLSPLVKVVVTVSSFV